MAFNKVTTYTDSENVVESEVGLVVKTREGTQAMATTEEDRKVIKAGSLFAGGTGEESGIVLHDYDVTDYADGYPIAVIVAGRVKADKVSTAAAEAKESLAAQGLYLV